MLEQSLITKFSPQLNLFEKEIVFTYTSWDPSTLNQSYDFKNPQALMVEVWLEDSKDILTTYSSIQRAADGLGVSRLLINKYINKSFSFENPILELNVLVKTSNRTMDMSPIVHRNVKKISSNWLWC